MTDGSKAAGGFAARVQFISGLKVARDCAVTLLAVVLLALVFFKARNVFTGFLYYYPSQAWIPFAITVVGALAFYRLRYQQIGGALATITRGCALTVLAFLVLEPVVLTAANPDSGGAAFYVEHAWAAAVAMGVLAVWRSPSFAIPVATYAISTRLLTDEISYFGISILDIRYVVDTTAFCAAMMCLTTAIDAIVRHAPRPDFFNVDLAARWASNRETFMGACAMAAVGFHLGNYFWSGVAKLSLNGGNFSWILHNPTHNGLLAAIEKGLAPLGAWSWANQVIFGGFDYLVVPINAVVVVAQLSCILAVLRVRWLLLLTYFYDLFHLAIYVCGGLFFYPWILNNLAIAAALWHYRTKPFPVTLQLAILAGVGLGYFENLAGAARLAWYDVADFRTNHFEAELSGGTRVRVPSSFFMSHSYTEAHGRFSVAPPEDHYGHTLGGSALRFERLKDSGECTGPTLPTLRDPSPTDARLEKLEQVRVFIRAHHAKMLDRGERYGHLNFYFRAHHQPSNPLLYPEFNGIDLKDVRRYHLVTESICLKLVDGRLKRSVLSRSEYPIDVQ